MNIMPFGILLDAFFVALLSWSSWTDWKARIVSNVLISLLLCLGLAHTALMILVGNTWWLYPAGLLLFIPFMIAWLRNSMGAADVKLIMAIGLYLGLLNTLLAFALMVPILAVLMAYSWLRHKTLKRRIPLAPILSFGASGAIVIGYLSLLMK